MSTLSLRKVKCKNCFDEFTEKYKEIFTGKKIKSNVFSETKKCMFAYAARRNDYK